MQKRRKDLNIFLIFLSLVLGGMAVWNYRRPPLVLLSGGDVAAETPQPADSVAPAFQVIAPAAAEAAAPDTVASARVPAEIEVGRHPVRATRFADAQPEAMTANHPFRSEAMKVLSGQLEETDSLNRHRILSYCEHLRTSYTTRDIDFIRQVFSDDALIIVGHVVRTDDSRSSGMSYSDKVRYSIRTKKAYLDKLAQIFSSGSKIDVKFSDFRIMRHPTMPDIYGVTLRQKYSGGTYSDDGYLFLLWDFRDPSMPLIHVRTWQPAPMSDDGDEMIDISDFNLG